MGSSSVAGDGTIQPPLCCFPFKVKLLPCPGLQESCVHLLPLHLSFGAAASTAGPRVPELRGDTAPAQAGRGRAGSSPVLSPGSCSSSFLQAFVQLLHLCALGRGRFPLQTSPGSQHISKSFHSCPLSSPTQGILQHHLARAYLSPLPMGCSA